MDAGPFQSRLLSGEQVLWGGRPAGGLLFTRRDLGLIPFSLVWLGFAVFWTVSAARPGTPSFFYLPGLVFVAIGLFSVAGRFVVDMWLRGRTFYAVTDQRVLILRDGPFASFISISRDTLPEVQAIGGDEDRGTLRFGHSATLFGSGRMAVWVPALDPTPQFLNIPEPQRVLALILARRNTPSPPASPDIWRRPDQRPSAPPADPTPDAPPPASPTTVAFRPPPLWTRTLTLSFTGAIAVVTAVRLSMPMPASFNVRIYATFMAIYFAVVIALVLVLRIYVRAKGVSPITFSPSYLEVPLSALSRGVSRIAYADVLSATAVGKGRTERLILDTRKRAFVYPTSQFVEKDALRRIDEGLHERILASADGAAQWEQMERRRATAVAFVAIRPVVTWILLAAIGVVYALQLAYTRSDDVFGPIVMGANAALLVGHGEWYRLVTANLLHANTLHLLNNALFAWIIGMIVERQLRRARYLIVVLGSGILSQMTSAAVAAIYPNHLYSVGISGALFGMLGAQAVLNRKFGAQVPGGYRFVARSWVALLAVNFVVLPLLVPQIDIAAHVGGFVSGAALCWLVCRAQEDIAQPHRHDLVSAVAAALCVLWIGSVVVVAGRAASADARAEDRTLVLNDMTARLSSSPELENAVAWAFALDRQATAAQIEAALSLATHAMQRATELNDKARPDIMDTVATLDSRVGDLDTALDLEAPLIRDPRPPGPFATRLAWFLDQRLTKTAEVREIPYRPNVLLPQVTLGHARDGAFRIDVATGSSLPQGAELWVLVRKEHAVVGLLWIALESTNEPRVWLRRGGTGPHPLADQVAAGAELVLAQVSTGGCNCTSQEARYFPYDPKVEQPPGG